MVSTVKISIQIPTYNQGSFISDAIQSSLFQTYPNKEIIIADDYSKDETAFVVDKFKNNPEIKYYKNEMNIGRVKNYHKALYKYCTGDWVINLDGDDYFTDPDFLDYAMNLITKHKDENIFVFQGNHNIQKLKKIFPTCTIINDEVILINGPEFFLKYYKVRRFNHCATLFKRSEALPLNFYSFNGLFTDFNSVSRLFLRGKIMLCGKKVATWRYHDGNQSSNLNQQNIQTELNSISEIAKFARPYFKDSQIKVWERKMKRYIKSTLIELLIYKPKSFSSIKYILKSFSWNYIYFKQLVRYFIGKD